MEKYILLYGDKKPEDNILITNMFKNSKKINLVWSDFDFKNDWNIIEEELKKGTEQIIFSGLEIGWDKLVQKIKEEYPKTKIKVICNTQDSLLYYEYERENFYKLLELSKNENIDDIGFLRKSQYLTYSNIGYKCSYIMEDYVVENKEKTNKEKNQTVNIGIYPLNYVWDKNIFNQLCVAKFVENSTVNYNLLDSRMQEFLDTMKIQNVPDKVETIDRETLTKKIEKNDVIIATSFTEYLHPVFFISMELGIPCLIGNNSDFFEEDSELKKYVVTTAEDNPIINGQMVSTMIDNKEKIEKLYRKWKNEYTKKAQESIKQFINK